MHPFVKRLTVAVLAIGAALATVPSPADAAPEPGLIQSVQYYRQGYDQHRRQGGYYQRRHYRHGRGFNGHRYDNHGRRF